MILYLSSKKFGNDEKFFKEWIENHNNKILLVINALDYKEKEKREKIIAEDTKLLENFGFKVDILDLKEYFNNQDKLKEICKVYNAISIIGGNVFILREAMKYSGLDKFLKEKINDDYLYIGYSAGSVVLAKNLELFKTVDEPIAFYNKNEIIYDGIGLIDYLFIPHYKSNYHKAHLIEEIVDICKNNNIKFKALKDDEFIIEKVKSM